MSAGAKTAFLLEIYNFDVDMTCIVLTAYVHNGIDEYCILDQYIRVIHNMYADIHMYT